MTTRAERAAEALRATADRLDADGYYAAYEAAMNAADLLDELDTEADASEGESCGICGQPAALKVGEENVAGGHNATQYLCAAHGAAVLFPYRNRETPGCAFCDGTGVNPRFLTPEPDASGKGVDAALRKMRDFCHSRHLRGVDCDAVLASFHALRAELAALREQRDRLRGLLVRARRNVEHSASHAAGGKSRELLAEIDAATARQPGQGGPMNLKHTCDGYDSEEDAKADLLALKDRIEFIMDGEVMRLRAHGIHERQGNAHYACVVARHLLPELAILRDDNLMLRGMLEQSRATVAILREGNKDA